MGRPVFQEGITQQSAAEVAAEAEKKKAMDKLIYADLEQQLNENIELKSRIDQLTTKVQEWISEELLEHELDLVCEEMSMVELFKALKIRITTQPESIFQKIMEILQIYKYLVKKKCLVLSMLERT